MNKRILIVGGYGKVGSVIATDLADRLDSPIIIAGRGVERAEELAHEIIKRGISEGLMWFLQARCDDIIKNRDALPKLRESGLRWVLLGVENSSQSTLDAYKKNISPEEAKEAVELMFDAFYIGPWV